MGKVEQSVAATVGRASGRTVAATGARGRPGWSACGRALHDRPVGNESLDFAIVVT